MTHEMRGSVMAAVRWTALSRIMMQVVTWTTTLIAVRLLSPSDYGVVAVASLFANYLGLLSEAGFGSAIIQKQVRDPVLLNSIFVWMSLIGATLAAVVFFSAPVTARLFGDVRAESVTQLIALQFLIGPLGAVPDAQLRMDLRFRELGTVNFVAVTVSSIALIVLAYFNAGPFALVGAMLSNQVIRIVLLNVISPQKIFMRTQLGRTREMLRYSSLILVERSVWYLYATADAGIVARMLGTYFAGVLTLAKSTIQAPLDRIAEVINAVSFPAYARIQNDRVALNAAFLQSIRAGAYLVFPLFWGIGSIADHLVPVVFGEKWLEAVVPLQLLSVALPLRALQSISTPLVHAIGRPDVSLISTVFALAVIFPLTYFGVSLYGLNGAAGAWALGFPFAFACSSTLFARALELRPMLVWKTMVRPAICATLMVLAVRGACVLLAPHVPQWVLLIAAIAVGAGAYTAIVVIIDRASFNELRTLMAEVFRRNRS